MFNIVNNLVTAATVAAFAATPAASCELIRSTGNGVFTRQIPNDITFIVHFSPFTSEEDVICD
jgi:hypothetical protein